MRRFIISVLILFVTCNSILADEKAKDAEAETEKKLARLKELAEQMDKLARQIDTERLEERELGQQIRLGYEPITNYYAIVSVRDEKAGKLIGRLYELEKEIKSIREEIKAIIEELPEYQEHQRKMKSMNDRVAEIVQNRLKLIAERNKVSAEYFRLRSELGTLPTGKPNVTPVVTNSVSSVESPVIRGAQISAIPKPETPCVTCEKDKQKMMEQSKKILERSQQ